MKTNVKPLLLCAYIWGKVMISFLQAVNDPLCILLCRKAITPYTVAFWNHKSTKEWLRQRSCSLKWNEMKSQSPDFNLICTGKTWSRVVMQESPLTPPSWSTSRLLCWTDQNRLPDTVIKGFTPVIIRWVQILFHIIYFWLIWSINNRITKLFLWNKLPKNYTIFMK